MSFSRYGNDMISELSDLTLGKADYFVEWKYS